MNPDQTRELIAKLEAIRTACETAAEALESQIIEDEDLNEDTADNIQDAADYLIQVGEAATSAIMAMEALL